MSLKIGIMSMAHLHSHAYASVINDIQAAELVGIGDHDLERAKSAAVLYKTSMFETYEALLASDIDAVVIASENNRHRALTEMAAKAGKHILCEKPLGTNPTDMQAMIDVCRSNNVQLMTAFPCRFSPAFQRMKSAVDEGKIGKVLAIRGTNRGRCPWDWFVDKSQSGGGAVIDHTVHVTDLMRVLLNSEVADVYAEIGNGIYHKEFDDSGFLTMTFENGVFATLDTSWSRPQNFPTWGDVTLSVVGERGTLSMDMFAQNLVLYSHNSPHSSWAPWGDNIDLLMVSAFVDAISNNKAVPITGEDGMKAANVGLAAYKSFEAGGPVVP